MRIFSNEYDKQKNGCYSYVKIIDGHVVAIGEEMIRDGGWYWLKKHGNQLQPALIDIARELPDFYMRIVTEAYEDRLPNIENLISGDY